MSKKIDLTGMRFFRWVVIECAPKIKNEKATKWLCKCDCGTEKTVVGHTLRNGTTKSCGCYKNEVYKTMNITHGASVNGNVLSEYNSWAEIKRRCYNPNCESFINYGARGIIMCDRWLNSFENFLEDMGKKPSEKHSLDRYPNNDTGIYEKSNCRWAISAEQNRNKRNNQWIEYNNIRMVSKDWANQFQTAQGNLTSFLKNNSFEEAYNYYMNKKSKKLLQHSI